MENTDEKIGGGGVSKMMRNDRGRERKIKPHTYIKNDAGFEWDIFFFSLKA